MVPFTIRMMFSIASSTRLFPLWIFLCAAYSYAGKIRFNRPSTVAPDYVDEQHNDELILNPCVRVCISTTVCLRGNVSVPQNKLCGTTDESKRMHEVLMNLEKLAVIIAE
uniref:Secreted protein n=1 Tax=Romanomermis culicivorax TaxID=13658 RepID=A0A915KF46_ROMCU